MAASSERKSFDRLEKFFSKRRKTSIAKRDSLFCVGNTSHFTHPETQQIQHIHHEDLELSPLQALSITSPTASHLNSPPQIFPSPSFIRPTTTRMLARVEANVTVKSCPSSRRAKSLPENASLPLRLPSIDELSPSPSPSPSPSLRGPPKVPKRTSSLIQRRRRDPSVAGLLEFSFQQKSGRLPDTPATLFSFDPSSPRGSFTQRRQSPKSGQLLEALPVIPSHRPDTPPHSDNEDCFWMTSTFTKTPPSVSTGAVITPEPSPKMRPSRIPIPVSRTPSKTTHRAAIQPETRAQKHRSLEETHEVSGTAAARLRKTVSDSTLSKAAPRFNPVPTLFEPTFNDFLKLSDDDIADDCPVTPSGKPPAFSLPPNPPVSPPVTYTGSPGSKFGPLITLKHNLTGRPAAHGAYTCARICKQFKFDLVYVINLWPVNVGYNSTAFPPSAVSAATTPKTTAPNSPFANHHESPIIKYSPRPKMTGRILAAHGLQNVPAPFQIGESVHQNILRNKGWRKWVNEDVVSNEFSEGYAYAFYNDSSATAEGKRPETGSPRRRPRTMSHGDAPRGIVFAAYRTEAAPMSKDELDRLFLEAEALVETLLDIHKTQRARLPSGQKAGAEETGPLPARPSFMTGMSPA